jgi:O-methyltransferase
MQVIAKEGDIAEVGVYKGGSGKLLSNVFKHTNKKIYLFDTFSGMPETDLQKDWHRKGDFSETSVETVKYYLRDCENVLIYSGLFPRSARNLEVKTFCLVHVDADIYKSVIDCCNFFYPKMVSGGILIFDDYGFITCPGAKIAVDEFFLHKPENICYLPTGQCFVVKR